MKARQPEDTPPKSTGQSGSPGWIWAVLFLTLLLAITLRGGSPPLPEVSYSRFRQELANGNVDSITLVGERIETHLKDPIELSREGEVDTVEVVVTHYPAFGDEELLQLIESQDVELSVHPDEGVSWWAVLFGLAPIVFFLIFLFILSRGLQSAGRGILSMGKSRARLYDRRQEKTTFADVAGSEGAKQELAEIIDFLRDPARVGRIGGEMPKGVLLVGPPGTGKTLLARAVAGEAGVPFFIISGSDFMEMFVGVGASRVRDLFSDAKGSAPSIVFIDELDSVGRRRGAGVGGGHDEREQTLNQLLSEMDGFEPNQGVVVMAATNRPDVLDPALLRPGRFDRQVAVDLPTLSDRVAILKVHARNKPLAPGVDFEEVARETPGFSGADLRNLLNEAALLVARRDKDQISRAEIDAARDKVVMGLKRDNLSLSEKECEILAYHEAGHAVVAAMLPHADPIRKVTIVPRSRSMGHTEQVPEKERFVYEKDYLLDRLAVMLGGRAAEEIFKQTATSGAESDLKQATRLARSMVLDWGMGEGMAAMALGGEQEDVFLGKELARRREYSEVTAREVDEEIHAILSAALSRARNVLTDQRDGVRRLVESLLEKEEVPGSEVLAILDRPKAEIAAVARMKRLRQRR